MEILNSAANKRTVLIVSCGEPEIERLAELVETEYRVVMINGKDRNFGEIRTAAGSISTALVARLKEEEKHFSLRGRNISISYGVSCMEHTDLQFQQYLDAADQEMYTNKKKHKQHLRAGR